MASGDKYDITQLANGPDANVDNARTPREGPKSKPWPPASDMPRQSRENIIRNYNAKDAMRARNTRLYSQEAMQDFSKREERTRERQRQRNEYASRVLESNVVSQPTPQSHMSQEQAIAHARELRAMNRQRSTMSTQESLDRTNASKENFEAERAIRDVFSSHNAGRTSNREVIDGRGSIDSRAFNERNELIGYSIDQQDKPDPLVETPAEHGTRWRSQAGQGFSANGGNRGLTRRQSDLNRLSDTISGRSDYQSRGPFSSLPTSAKLLILLIIILLGVLIYLLFF